MKELSEMSLNELWQLFPIFLTEHNDDWKKQFSDEKTYLSGIIPNAVTINHIGSTAVDSIWAKPIIDILAEVETEADLKLSADSLIRSGYTCMSREPKRISLNKGYTKKGFAEKVFHLHLRLCGDNDELYFRDYLIEHPDIAREYEKLKKALWKKYEHDRNAYTDAKTAFINQYTNKAKFDYGKRYL